MCEWSYSNTLYENNSSLKKKVYVRYGLYYNAIIIIMIIFILYCFDAWLWVSHKIEGKAISSARFFGGDLSLTNQKVLFYLSFSAIV